MPASVAHMQRVLRFQQEQLAAMSPIEQAPPHTPLPWSFWSNETGAWMIEAGTGGHTVICQRNDWNHKASESVANGRLFFESPHMAAELSQLEIEFQSFIDCDTSPTREWLIDNVASIRSVLAKVGL